MFKDPLTNWEGLFPYDALAPAGITPESSMEEVKDASFELMARGLMTPEVRAAWDQLRIKQKRMLVDVFLYQFDPQEQMRKTQAALEQQWDELTQIPDATDLLRVTPEDLRQIERDLREIPTPSVDLSLIPEFSAQPPAPDADFIQFDL